jgi:putative photosynthetic complex assembly protein
MKPVTVTMPSGPADTFPRWVLLSVGAILAFSLISVALVRLTGNGPDQLAAQVLELRTLRFEDRSNGSVAVIDGTSGKLLEELAGEQGFLRGTVRALARERLTRHVGPEQAFELIASADGRLVLSDPVTGQRIDLASFGPSNAAVFARYLPSKAVALTP